MNSFYDWPTYDDDKNSINIYIQTLEQMIQETNTVMRQASQSQISMDNIEPSKPDNELYEQCKLTANNSLGET